MNPLRHIGRAVAILGLLTTAMLAASIGGRRRPGGGDRKSGDGKKGGHGGVPSSVTEAQARAEAEVDALAIDGAEPEGGARPPRSTVEGPAANHELLPPNKKRHDLNQITPKTHAQKVNSVVEPDVDMGADIGGIQRGEGRWNPDTNEYEINGRTYKVENTGTDGLRTYPTGGDGVHNLDQLEYRILQSMIKNDGDIDAAWQQNYRNPNVTPERWSAALNAFSSHKSNNG